MMFMSKTVVLRKQYFFYVSVVWRESSNYLDKMGTTRAEKGTDIARA